MPTPKASQHSPYILTLDAGTYMWCGCGLSKDQPFCDNSHKGTGYEGTAHVAKLFEVEEDGTRVVLCGCRRTGNPPFCDGTHANPGGGISG